MIDIGKFIDVYEAKYGKFPANAKRPAQIEEWRRVLSLIPEHRLNEVFAIVSKELGNSNKNPRTREFENALKQMEVIDNSPSSFKGEGCGMCYNSGIISVWVTYMPNETKRLGFHEGGYLYQIGCPCKCSKGMYLRATYYQSVTVAQQEMCFQWLREQVDIAESKGINVLRFLHYQAKAMLRSATIRHRGKKLDWLKELLGKKETGDVVRSSGERAKLGTAADS